MMHNICSNKKMKLKYVLPLFLLILFGCSKVQGPEFRKVGNFKLKGLGLDQTRIGFNVTYFNPNNFGVTVKQAEADVYIDSTYLGRFIQDSAIAVNRNAEFSIPFSGAIAV